MTSPEPRVACRIVLACLLAVSGCGRKAESPPPAVPSQPGGATPTEHEGSREAQAPKATLDESTSESNESKPAAELKDPKTPDAPLADAGPKEPWTLELEGISLVVPPTWRKVKPATRIIDAEFELPRAATDEYDGRLTLMSALGDRDTVISQRTAEFTREPGTSPRIEPIMLGAVEATWVDLRGEWKGPAFQPIDPRADYRMLLVIIPFTPRSAFYAKLTGPRETITAREQEFREFIESAKITLPQAQPAAPNAP
jgi:hypothetical protein